MPCFFSRLAINHIAMMEAGISSASQAQESLRMVKIDFHGRKILKEYSALKQMDSYGDMDDGAVYGHSFPSRMKTR